MSRKSTVLPGTPKLSDIASQAKRYYIPKIEQDLPDIPARSYGYSDVASHSMATVKTSNRRLRVAVLDADAVDIALQWNHEDSRHQGQDLAYTTSPTKLRIPLILGVDEKRAGGNWESSYVGPEENLCRRSNLVRCLARVRASPSDLPIYPIPSRGGIYSPQVVVYRGGPSGSYSAWDTSRWDWLPVISVAPGRRPKVRANTRPDNSNDGEATEGEVDYIFTAERELMRDKIRTALRLAAIWGHQDIVIGSFGLGAGFHNPPRQLSAMWKQVLFEEEEFRGVFENVVFAIEHVAPASPTSTSSNVLGHSARPSTITSTAGSPITADDDTNIKSNTLDENISIDGNSSTSSGPTSGFLINSFSDFVQGPSSGYSSDNQGVSLLSGSNPVEAPAAEEEPSVSLPMSDYEIFKEEFAPKRLCKINLSYRKKN